MFPYPLFSTKFTSWNKKFLRDVREKHPEQLLCFGSDNIKQVAPSSIQMAGRCAQIDGIMTFKHIHTAKKKKKYLFKIFITDLILTSTKFCAGLYSPSLSTLVSNVNKPSILIPARRKCSHCLSCQLTARKEIYMTDWKGS